MFYKKKLFVAALTFTVFLMTLFTNAQTVIVVLKQPPPNQWHVEDLWQLTLINTSQEFYNVYLYGTVEEAGAGLIFEGTSATFELPANFSGPVNPGDLEPVDVGYTNGDYEEIVMRTGTLPAGTYTICVYIKGIDGEDMGYACIYQIIAHPSPPELINPVDEANVTEELPVFLWLHMSMGEFARYYIKMVEILDGQTPIEAMESNPPWFEETEIFSTSFQFPISAREFEQGATYAWQVIAISGDDWVIGESQVWSFNYGAAAVMIDEEPTTLKLIYPIDSEVTQSVYKEEVIFEWEWSGSFSDFEILVYDNPCGRYSTPTPVPTITLTPILTPTTPIPTPFAPTTSLLGRSGLIPAAISNIEGAQSFVFNLENILEPGQAFIWQVYGTSQDEEGNEIGVLSSPQCLRYTPLDPETGEPPEAIPCEPGLCNITVDTTAAPAMSGGLDPPNENLTIQRGEFVPLKAVGLDFDELWWYCKPCPNCPEKGSERMQPLTGKVRFEWEITKGEGGFVNIACTYLRKKDKGDRVIFEPPDVEKGEKKVTEILLKIIDDNPTQPIDTTVKRNITITTEWNKGNPDEYTININSDQYKLPTVVVITPTLHKCRAESSKWDGPKDLKAEILPLPIDTLISNEWVRLEAKDFEDPDVVKLNCSSVKCTPGSTTETYNDDIRWTWRIVKGDGRFVKGNIGRFVIYEAPSQETKVEIEVKIDNPYGFQCPDDPVKGKRNLVIKKTIKFLTQNTMLIPTGAKVVAERIPYVNNLIKNYDIIGLQEVMEGNSQDKIVSDWYKKILKKVPKKINLGKEILKREKRTLAELEKRGTFDTKVNKIETCCVVDSHIVLGPDKIGAAQDGGLIILSKYPIIKSSALVYKNTSSLAEALWRVLGGSGEVDYYTNKGALYARIDLFPKRKGKKCYIHVFNTHTQAGTGEKYSLIRKKQFGELKKFIKKCIEDTNGEYDGRPIILMGDLNVVGGSPEYGQLVSLIKKLKPGLEDVWPEKHLWDPGYTWIGKDRKLKQTSPWGKRNTLAADDGGPERLDYYFYYPGQKFTKLKPTLIKLVPSKPRKIPYCFGCELKSHTVSDHLGIEMKCKIMLP